MQWILFLQWILMISGREQNTLQQKVQNLLKNSHEIELLYSNHVHHHSPDLNNLLNEIHQDISQKILNPTDKRHILTILTDDQGWGDIGYNDPTFVTPTLDFFAGHGIKLENFYVHVCLSSSLSPVSLISQSEHLYTNSCCSSHWFICFTNRITGSYSPLFLFTLFSLFL
jgi:hypothetical protein